MGQGSFDFNPPDFVLNATKIALDQVDCNQYPPTKGRLCLRQALAEAYSPTFGRKLDPESDITIITGANEGILSTFLAFLNPGDKVIVFEPFFDHRYISNIELTGAKIRYVPLHPPPNSQTTSSSAADWWFDINELRGSVTDRTKMIVVNTPNNPLGKVFSKAELEDIGRLCLEHNLIILSDEVYNKLGYVPFCSMASLGPEIARRTLIVGSVGKDFYATAWRIGFLMGSKDLVQHTCSAHTRVCFVSPGPSQEAADVGYEEASKRGFWDQSKSEMLRRMNDFNEIWDELGLPYSKPDGGYFVLANLSKVQIPHDYKFPAHIAERPRDFKLSWFLINELGVAAIPPTEFYTNEHAPLVENFLRFGVSKTEEKIKMAKERLRGLKKYIS